MHEANWRGVDVGTETANIGEWVKEVKRDRQRTASMHRQAAKQPRN